MVPYTLAGRYDRWFVFSIGPVAIMLSLGVVLLSSQAVLGYDSPLSTVQGQADASQATAGALTRQLMTLHVQSQQGDAVTRSNALAGLVDVAAARQERLAALIAEHPEVVLGQALSAQARAALPAGVQAYLEKEEDAEGELEVLHEDGFNQSRYLYFLKRGDERISLHFAADAPALQTGDRVRVAGLRVLQAMAVWSGQSQVQVQSLALPNTLGAQRTVVILVNFQDNPNEAWSAKIYDSTATQLQNVSMSVPVAQQIVLDAASSGSVSNFYKESSYQQTWLTGDVFGMYTIPVNSTQCDAGAIASAAQQAATQHGVVLGNYTRHVYAFPGNACSWWGLGTVGGNPAQAWINGSFQSQVVAHEMGHGLGLYHSHGLDCGATVIGGSSPTSGCTAVEYGDSVDTMGGALPPAQFNSVQKELLGWLNYGGSPPIATAQTSGVYTVDPYELTGGSNPKALKIPTPSGDWYYVEYRQPIGFDYHETMLSYSNLRSGVVVHLFSQQNPNGIYLLDMTPSSSYVFHDAALGVGFTFTDPAAGISIVPLWANGTAGVNVTLGTGGTCVRNNPTVNVSPGSQQGPAGTTLGYTVSVRNNDSGCPASTFTQSAGTPSGWTASFAPATLSLGPGATASTTMQVKSPTTATAGSYVASATSTNGSASSYYAAAPVTYQVVTACVRSKPTVSVAPADQQGAAGTTLSYTMSVTNNDSGCAASSFTHSATVPFGWTAAFASTTVSLASGATGSTTMQVKSATTALAGAYTIVPSTANQSAPSYSSSATATYDVASAGTPGAFTDDFSRPDSSILGNGWTQIAGSLGIQSGQARNGTTKGMHTAVQGALVGSAQTVSMSFASLDNNLGPRFGLLARYKDARNYYTCYRQTGGSSTLRIAKVVSGVETVLKQVAIPNPQKNVFFSLSCQAQGATLTLSYNGGSTKMSVSDSTFSSGGVGMTMGYPISGTGTAASHEADNFYAIVQ